MADCPLTDMDTVFWRARVQEDLVVGYKVPALTTVMCSGEEHAGV